MCVLCITYVGLVILNNTCRPMNTYRAIIFISMFVIITLLIAFLPSYFGIYKMPGLTNTLLCLVIVLATIPMVRFFSDILKKVELEKIIVIIVRVIVKIVFIKNKDAER